MHQGILLLSELVSLHFDSSLGQIGEGKGRAIRGYSLLLQVNANQARGLTAILLLLLSDY
jgi:hypothetical protein